MISFSLIFAAGLAGYAGLPVWAAAACIVGLIVSSYAEHSGLYERAQLPQQHEAVGATLLASSFNALIAGGVAYGGGWFLQVI